MELAIICFLHENKYMLSVFNLVIYYTYFDLLIKLTTALSVTLIWPYSVLNFPYVNLFPMGAKNRYHSLP